MFRIVEFIIRRSSQCFSDMSRSLALQAAACQHFREDMNLTWKDLGVAGDATALIVHGLNRWGGADVHRLDLYVRMAEASAGDDCSKSNHCLRSEEHTSELQSRENLV